LVPAKEMVKKSEEASITGKEDLTVYILEN
jgi:hypothetical protein